MSYPVKVLTVPGYGMVTGKVGGTAGAKIGVYSAVTKHAAPTFELLPEIAHRTK